MGGRPSQNDLSLLLLWIAIGPVGGTAFFSLLISVSSTDGSEVLRTISPEVLALTILSSGAVCLWPSLIRRYPNFETDWLSMMVGSAALAAVYCHVVLGWLLPIASSFAPEAPVGSSGLGGIGRVMGWILYQIGGWVVTFPLLLVPRALASKLGPGAFSTERASSQSDEDR